METKSPDQPWNWINRTEYGIPLPLGKPWAAWVSNSHTNSHHHKSSSACFPEFSLCEKSSRTCRSTSLQLEATHSYKGKCMLQNNSLQRHVFRWWDPAGSHHPSLGKPLISQRCQTASKALMKHAKGGCDRSSAAFLAQQRVKPALDQMLEEPLSKQEKACACSTHTDKGFRDSWWEPLSWAGGRSPGEHMAAPPHQCVLHSQLWGSGGYTTSGALITVANVLLIGFWRLEPTATVFQNTPVCALLKITFRLSHN